MSRYRVVNTPRKRNQRRASDVDSIDVGENTAREYVLSQFFEPFRENGTYIVPVSLKFPGVKQ